MVKHSKFTSAEKKLIESHVSLGLSFLKKDRNINPDVIEIVGQHHEFCNGSGYPHQLKQAEILLCSRILVVAEYYDELMQGLSGAAPMISGKAVRELFNLAKTKILDVDVVTHLIQLLGVFPLTSAVMLNTKEKAIVAELNRKQPLLPKVKVFYNKQNHPLSKPMVIDLSKQDSSTNTRSIEKVIDPEEVKTDPARLLQPEEHQL
ncbi:MAG: hypothetical protein HON94_14465 [Methylococcales bacterium]|jgi:HD-GYP domain-containing protein (c-di-GMP phosphodiesterase class II)|nr:hypothetical protein [Methylococcales bacterium]MBT7410527.1 hypothetical protein [Methylococcales bacterium]